MKFFAFIVVILAAITYCHGYSFVIPAGMKHPGTCYYNGMMLKQGDNSMPSTCQNVHCNEDGSILVQGCGHYDMKDCRILDPVNLHKPYPECCRMNFMCTDKDGDIEYKVVSPLDRKVFS